MSAMAEPRKRRPTQDGDLDRPSSKRARTRAEDDIPLEEDVSLQSDALHLPSIDELAKNGLRRGVVLALQQVGFESASPAVLEGFTNMTETCELAR
jgi:transcription initiation factor TFIID subunit 8